MFLSFLKLDFDPLKKRDFYFVKFYRFLSNFILNFFLSYIRPGGGQQRNSAKRFAFLKYNIKKNINIKYKVNFEQSLLKLKRRTFH